VYSHHEWFNGEGYPRRLRGEEIPLGARIVAIVNASITCDLPYRTARTFSAAPKEIAMFAGRQFDAEIVTVCLGMPDEIWEDLRREIEEQAD
jgi:HD-GYP domain-containing protein (c-di-GMP phosphodiesterase class II)